jgi:hypothetical protein
MKPLEPIDHSALKVNQLLIIILLLIAFIFNVPVLVALVSGLMLGGSLLWKRPAFGWVYHRVLKPLGWVKPDAIPDHREPHLFAQGVGGTFLAASALTLFSGFSGVGWILSWIVIALAALNVFGGFCLGCAMYYWFNRFGIPGFTQSPPAGTLPGFRPRKES